MTLIALGDNQIINLESIASAAVEDAHTRSGQTVKLTITFAAGQNATFSGEDAKTLWTALRDNATKSSFIPRGPQLTILRAQPATGL